MGDENGLGAGAAVLDRSTQDTINGAKAPPTNRQGEQRSLADQLRGGATESSFNLDQWMKAAQAKFDTTKAMHAEDAKDGKIDGAVNGDTKALDAHRQLIEDINRGMDLLAEDSKNRNEARLKPQPIIINGMQPGDMGYNSYGLANGFNPMGAYNPFTPMGAPMMPTAPQMRVKQDGSGVEIVAPDGSVVHTYASSELVAQGKGQDLSEADRKKIGDLTKQAELARAEVEKAKFELVYNSSLTDTQKQQKVKTVIDNEAKSRAAHSEINSIMGISTPLPGNIDQGRMNSEPARFMHEWLKDEREFVQRRIKEHEKVQLKLYQGDHEMLRRVAQRQMEQDIKNNAGWVRTYQQIYQQQQRAQIQDWTAEQRWQRNEITQNNKLVRRSLWQNIFESASQTFVGGLFSRLTGSIFGDNILRAQNRDYDRVVRSNQQYQLRLDKQNNKVTLK